MSGNLENHRRDLQKLAGLGERMLIDLSLRDATLEPEQKSAADRQNIAGSFERDYQLWYTEAAAVVAQLIPGRKDEFDDLYRGDGRRKIIDPESYNIQDWLIGRRLAADEPKSDPLNEPLIVSMRLKMQIEILRSAEARLKSSLFEMRRLARADVFDSELDACRELAANGFLRAAGAIAGVMLEKHLQQVVDIHDIVFRRREPTINDYNDQLKNAGVLDVPGWRQIQRLGDIRNLCGHSKHRDPSKEEIQELIDGVERIVATLA